MQYLSIIISEVARADELRDFSVSFRFVSSVGAMKILRDIFYDEPTAKISK